MVAINRPARSESFFANSDWLSARGNQQRVDILARQDLVADAIQHAPLKRPERIRVNDPADDIDYFWIWPNLMLNVYPDNFSTNLIVPLGPMRTLTLFDWYFRDPDAPDVRQRIDETIAFSDEIQLEDIYICEAVQRGLCSATYDSGRYSPSRENGVHHFHGLYAEAMGMLR